MSTEHEKSQFTRLLTKINKTKADILFLKDCKNHKVHTSFIRVKCNLNNSRTEKVIQHAKNLWLISEIQHHYSCLDKLQLDLYTLHLKMTKGLDKLRFEDFNKFHSASIARGNAIFEKKRATQNVKIKKLISGNQVATQSKPSVKTVNDLVVNLSNETFDNDEMNLLNRGLNFTVKPQNDPIIDIVAHIESSIQYKPFDIKKNVRDSALPLLKSAQTHKCKETTNWDDTLNKLKKHDVFYMKSDKGNKVVIMNKADYEHRMKVSIQEDSFTTAKKSPLNAMIKDAKIAIDSISRVFGVNKFRLRNPNPSVPLMYGLPKVHKSANKMRKIVSNINSPFSNITKWLVNELKKFGPFNGFSVKNTFDFVEKVQDIEIENDEIMISFDVTALFPSVPINIAIESIKKHLITFDLPEDHLNTYITAIELCMKHNCFKFRGTYYTNNFGCSMGNSLSPYVAEAFMCNLESQLKSEGILPRIWYRYVDDTFAIVKISKVEKTLAAINNRYPSIKFTFEKEDETTHTLPFLDLKIKRREKSIEFAVYRKPTSTDRYITNDSFCTYQQKIASFHSMVYRLCRLPLSAENYLHEYKQIKNIADVNGFKTTLIDQLINKHSKNIKRNTNSTLFTQNQTTQTSQKQRVSMPFAPTITNTLRHIYAKSNMQMIHTNNNKLRFSLGSTKDKIPIDERSGVYEVICSHCGRKYIGQTKRALRARIEEHLRAVRLKRTDNAIAAHAYDLNHSEPHNVFSFENNVRLLKNVNNPTKLDAYESLFISINDNLMNLEPGAIESPLFNCIKNRNK